MGENEPGLDEAERHRIEAEFLEKLQEEMRHVTVEEHLLHLVRSLPSMAFQYMGIYQAEGVKDLEQARLAIDAFRALLEVLTPRRTPEELAMYRSTLAQMQMTFVTAAEQDARGAPGAPPPGDDEERAEEE